MTEASKNLSTFTNTEVTEILKKAKRALKHPGLDILCHPSPENLNHGRILVVTSRKIGPAVKRNLIRRRLKAIFYEEKLYEQKWDYICIIKKQGINLTFNQLKDILICVSNKIKIVKENNK
ncbi:MAG: ribonuclease P [candidate division TM6 bacterium GW2011_GWF2_30_66]|jgi:ribonuclease P protein component|nr:MAG: ribonuclease P [candidate division TM6 bacterium GW2011_GWF2_30_66]